MRLLGLLLLLPMSVWAAEAEHAGHYHDHSNDTKLSVGAMASVSTFSRATVANEGLWRIRGAVMGGHATPVRKGARVDHAAIWGQYQWSPKWSLQAEIAVHDEGSSQLTPELDQLQLNFQPLPKFAVSMGRMSSDTTPSLNHHQGAVAFNEATLMADTLFGRHVHDTGVKVNFQPHTQMEVGAEAWKGDFFPATKGQGAGAVYVKFKQNWHAWDMKLGAWAMQAEAIARGDARYNDSGHSHGTSTSTPVDVRFTGNTKLNGIWVETSHTNRKGLKLGLQAETAVSNSTGELADTSRKAGYSHHYTSYTVTPYLDYKKLQLSYRYERLDLHNTVSGSGATLLAQEANLLNNRSPQRDTLQMIWRLTPQLITALAYTRDKTLSATGDKRVSLNVQWSDTLYRR